MKTSVITICGIIQVIFITAFAVAANITKPNTFTNGTTADASQVNANFDTAYGQINKNTANISTLATSVANAFTGLSTRIVTNGYAYNASNYIGSQISATSCGTGEIITGGTCSCEHTNYRSTTTNFGIASHCGFAGNTIIGFCVTDYGSEYTYKYGPPITTYAVCMSVNTAGAVPLAKIVTKSAEAINSEPPNAELEAAIEKMKREMEEYVRMRQDTK